LSPHWMECVEAGIDEAKKAGMHAWVYDENGFLGSDIAGGTDTHGGPKLVAYNDRQNEVCDAMLSVHSDFDYGDEPIAPFHSKVEGEQFLVGDVGYRIAILPEPLSVRRNSLELLKGFTADGRKDAGARAWWPYRFDVTQSLKPGPNEVALQLFGSCRNLLGPHRRWRG